MSSDSPHQPDSNRPKLRRGLRLQWEEVQRCHVLLYPEGMVKLNDSSAAILKLCDGLHTPDAIIATLEGQFQTQGLKDDVDQFLKLARQQQWI